MKCSQKTLLSFNHSKESYFSHKTEAPRLCSFHYFSPNLQLIFSVLQKQCSWLWADIPSFLSPPFSRLNNANSFHPPSYCLLDCCSFFLLLLDCLQGVYIFLQAWCPKKYSLLLESVKESGRSTLQTLHKMFVLQNWFIWLKFGDTW